MHSPGTCGTRLSIDPHLAQARPPSPSPTQVPIANGNADANANHRRYELAPISPVVGVDFGFEEPVFGPAPPLEDVDDSSSGEEVWIGEGPVMSGEEEADDDSSSGEEV